ncbi:hypothetical protein H112_04039 [Trichophyton rubrum D6]|uniref:Uncharacterized protein n=2 Tax=Trichophyton TaxID=5550 RepID=A0A022W3M4_TRIRU|nr:hypothetical protein H100_04046 [Trichophyton rubrum MR850]EZF42298.1 hypothetical protein H102_04033 [Trichophyton rubrum CBS 100081]EZF52962.1 hypothetical protein H103_04046 [Trichophyton rubrum CBS 288.86]EZF63602.1 hypothetical protein H104_04032 [Trichophyton rubrum CBS 289.86]EZF74376.1 hypothetical protein H105_04062 [Trichophyton soudanense CBS 452.61]EZF84869.1 hypothetical protein H110_04040 [Trichophyton rubrum MR1448]EZF95629.1 hypothetical protein H113_04076 [Trichophyton rub
MAIQVGQEKIFPPPSNSLQGKKKLKKGAKMPFFVARLAFVSLTVIWDEAEKSTKSENCSRSCSYPRFGDQKYEDVVGHRQLTHRNERNDELCRETPFEGLLVQDELWALSKGSVFHTKYHALARSSNGADRIQIMYLPALAKLLHAMPNRIGHLPFGSPEAQTLFIPARRFLELPGDSLETNRLFLQGYA